MTQDQDLSPNFVPEPDEATTSKQTTTDNNQRPSDFTVIWNNLTYKVDSRPWHKRAKESCFGRSQEERSRDSTSDSDSDSQSSQCNGERTILNSICGDMKSRQLTGILGPSGAGKSTLLSCLFQNRTEGTTGQILADGNTKTKLKVCFIPQHDYLNEWLTVREDLIFVSKLKSARTNHSKDEERNQFNGSTTPDDGATYVISNGSRTNTSLIAHEANAERVAELLGLTNCLDVRVKNISGGQKKRLSIARELMSKPDILILDEPTTGLDSLTCYKTMLVLKDLAHLSPHPMAVIVTIHQPPRSVFNLFDKTCFISKKGRIIYDDHPKNVVKTLEFVGGVHLPVPNYNPASFLIEIASDEHHGNLIDSLSRHHIDNFRAKYDATYLKNLMQKKSDLYRSDGSRRKNSNYLRNVNSNTSQTSTISSLNPIEVDSLQGESLSTFVKTSEVRSSLGDKSLRDTKEYFICHQLKDCLSSYPSSFIETLRHTSILTHRCWLSVIRNPSLTKSKFAFHVMLPLVMLLLIGTEGGKVKNCPKLEFELDMASMTKSIKDGTISKNINEIRLGGQNMSLFFILSYGFAINIISCTASFYPLTMKMFRKETINGLYSPAPYFIGQMLAELPLEVLFPTMSMILTYSLSGQEASYLEWRMFSLCLAIFLTCYAIHAQGLLCGALCINDVNLSVMLGQALLFPHVMFSGFLIRPQRMSAWMVCLSYLSIFRLGLMGIISSRYGFNLCNCDETILPEDGKIAFSVMPPNVKHVMEYMFPKNQTAGNDFEITEVFDALGDRFVKAQTFALDIKTCNDVKPFVMELMDVRDSDLVVCVLGLLAITFTLKSVTYSIMKSFPHRMS